MDQRQQIIKRELTKVSRQSFWLGVILGLLGGLIAGLAIGYALGSPQVHVIPLSEGIKT